MDVAGEYTFDAPQQLVWKSLLDPNVLGSIMPGGKGFQQTAENQYNGTLEVKVGPVQGIFQGQITLSDIQPPNHYAIVVDGKGPAGFVKGSGKLDLDTQGSQTHMVYAGTAQIGGRIASVGQRLMDSAARSIIRQSLDALKDYLKVEIAKGSSTDSAPAAPTESTPPVDPAPASGSDGAAPLATATATATAAAPVATATTTPPAMQAAPSPQYKPPSQTSLALNVARDVLNDFVPPKYQPLLFGAIAVILLLLIWLASR